MAPRTPPRAPRNAIVLKLAVSASLLTLLFWRVDRAAFLRSLQTLPLSVLLGCAALYILGYLISIVRWRGLLLAEGIRLPITRLGLVYFEGAFFNLFLPTVIGGDLVRAYFIHKMTKGHDAALASILVDRVVGFAALMGIAVTALALAHGTLQDPLVALAVLTVAVLFACGLAALLHGGLLRWISGLLRAAGLARAHAKLQGFVDAVRRYRLRRWALLQALVLSGLIQVIVIVTYYVIGVGVNVGVPLPYYFVFVPLITTLAMLPISVAGLGVREGGVVFLFSKVGVDTATALGMSFAWFSLTIIVSGLGGLAFLVDNHASKRREDA
jgi:hypothetical protein